MESRTLKFEVTGRNEDQTIADLMLMVNGKVYSLRVVSEKLGLDDREAGGAFRVQQLPAEDEVLFELVAKSPVGVVLPFLVLQENGG